MNKRQIKLSCYLEQLNIEVVKVEMILNQLNRLKFSLTQALSLDFSSFRSKAVDTCPHLHLSVKPI